MISDDRRRSRLIGLRIRQQRWEFEAVQANALSAREVFRQAAESLDETAAVIDSAESGLRDRMSASLAVDPERLQDTGRFLQEQQQIQRQRVSVHQRASQSLQQGEERLNYEARVLKALKGVKETADRQVLVEQEKQQAALAEELWLQRWRARG